MILNDRVLFKIQYKTKTHKIKMRQSDDIRLLKSKLENLIDFKLTNFKYIYNKNNITFVNENYQIMEFFGTKQKEFIIELSPKEFVEASHLEQFERSFNAAVDFDPDNENSVPVDQIKAQKQENQPNPNVLYEGGDYNSLKEFNQNKPVTDITSQKSDRKKEETKKVSLDPEKDPTKFLKDRMDDYVHDGRKLCAGDNRNIPTYICTKCRTLWCNYCIKFDVHTKDLVRLEKIIQYTSHLRDTFKTEINQKIINDIHYNKLDRIDFILNDKIKEVENQYLKMEKVIKDLKEQQTKFLIDLYYNKVENKTYKEIKNGIEIFTQKSSQHTTADKNVNSTPDDKLDRVEDLDKLHKYLVDTYEEFRSKFDNFNNVFSTVNNFNETFISQLQGKYQQNVELKKNIENPEKLAKSLKGNIIHIIIHINIIY